MAKYRNIFFIPIALLLLGAASPSFANILNRTAITGLDQIDNALYDAFTLNTGENFNGNDRGLMNDSKVENVSKNVEAGIKAATSGLQLYQTNSGEWRFVGSDSTYEERLAAHLGGRDLSETVRQNEQLLERTNNATDENAAGVQDIVQQWTNIAGNQGNEALLYTNNGSGVAGNAQAYASEADHQLGINTDRTDLSDPSEFVETIAHENRHLMTQGSGNGEEALATLYGRETAYQWDRSNTLEGRHTGGYSGRSMDDWRTANADSTLLANNNTRVSLVKTHNMDFRQFNFEEAGILDKARVKIGQLPVSQATKDYLAFSLDAVACAEVRCAAQIPPEDPKYEKMKRMQDAGDALGEGKFAEMMAKLGVDTKYEVEFAGMEDLESGPVETTQIVQGFKYSALNRMGDATQAAIGDEIEAGHEYVEGGYEFGVYAIAATVALGGNEDAKGFAEYMAGQVNTTWTDAEISSIGLTTENSLQAGTWQPNQGIAEELVMLGIDLVPAAKPLKAVKDVGETLLKKGRKVVPKGTLSKTEFDQRFGDSFASQGEANEAFKQYELARNADSEIVLGRLPDTEAGSQLGMTRLNSDNWTPNVNDSFVQGGIDAGKPFYLGSNPDISNYRAAWNALEGNRGSHPQTVFFREMKQLRDAGYRLEGDYMLPPN